MTLEELADWKRTERHLVLPGKELAMVPLGSDDHRIAIYDPDNPGAYIVGDHVEVGTDGATARRPSGPVGDE